MSAPTNFFITIATAPASNTYDLNINYNGGKIGCQILSDFITPIFNNYLTLSTTRIQKVASGLNVTWIFGIYYIDFYINDQDQNNSITVSYVSFESNYKLNTLFTAEAVKTSGEASMDGCPGMNTVLFDTSMTKSPTFNSWTWNFNWYPSVSNSKQLYELALRTVLGVNGGTLIVYQSLGSSECQILNDFIQAISKAQLTTIPVISQNIITFSWGISGYNIQLKRNFKISVSEAWTINIEGNGLSITASSFDTSVDFTCGNTQQTANFFAEASTQDGNQLWAWTFRNF